MTQAPSLLVGMGGALVGAEAYQAAADLRADAGERTMVLAANRLIVIAVAAIALGTALALAGIVEPRDLLLGIGGA